MISGVDDILNESEFTLGTDEIPYFTHEYQDNIRNAKSTISDEDDEDLDDEDEDEDHDDTDEDDDDRSAERKKEETTATTVRDLITKQQVLYAILGALIGGVGVLVSGLLVSVDRGKVKRPHQADHGEWMQMMQMMLLQQMMLKMNSSDNSTSSNGEFRQNEEMSAAHAKILPSHEQFLQHIKKYGGERMPSEDLKPGDLTYKLKPYRQHEVWKVEKHMNGDIAEAYKQCEYMK